jgi:hypothetical protein
MFIIYACWIISNNLWSWKMNTTTPCFKFSIGTCTCTWDENWVIIKLSSFLFNNQIIHGELNWIELNWIELCSIP